MKLPFVKMQAQGNDFVIVNSDAARLGSEQLPALARAVCDRHYGLGADGLVYLETDPIRMTIHNSDGSRAEMCGSALRCCCALLHQKSRQSEFEINTDAGPLRARVLQQNPDYVIAEIGSPVMVQKDLVLGGFKGDHVTVGNPHFVIHVPELSTEQMLAEAPLLSAHPLFPEGVNIEFVRIKDDEHLEVLVWERGVGPTLACGTGAAAAVFSGQSRGFLQDKVNVVLPGGEVKIDRNGNLFLLGGETGFVAEGTYIWKI